MVLGLGSKSRKGSSVRVEYLIHLQEIKPWPLSLFSKTQTSVILQWERGDKHSGSTRTAKPQIGLAFEEGRIVFNESFRLPATLFRESPIKGSKSAENDKFRKKCLVFKLFEAKNEKPVRGHLLGSGEVNLAKFGVLEKTIITSVLLDDNDGLLSPTQPSLFFSVGPHGKMNAGSVFDSDRAQLASICSSPSSRHSSSNRVSLDKDIMDYMVPVLLSDEDAEEDITSFTDDTSSPRSSVPFSPISTTCASEAKGDLSYTKLDPSSDITQVEAEMTHETVETNFGTVHNVRISSPEALLVNAAAYSSKRVLTSRNTLSHASSTYSSSCLDNPRTDLIFESSFCVDQSPLLIGKFPVISRIYSVSSASMLAIKDRRNERSTNTNASERIEEENEYDGRNENEDCKVNPVQSGSMKNVPELINKAMEPGSKEGEEMVERERLENQVVNEEDIIQVVEPGIEMERENVERQVGGKQTFTPCQDIPRTDIKVQNGSKTAAGLMTGYPHDSKFSGNVSVESVGDFLHATEFDDSHIEELKEISLFEKACTGGGSTDEAKPDERIKFASMETRSITTEEVVKQMELKIEKLEGELREAAAIEAAVYSVAADHGSSSHKVHSPARRLARLYIHACKHWGQEQRAGASRNAVSGLIFAVKACGSDVPRLTFWWSNTVVLREIISQAFDSSQMSPGSAHAIGSNGLRKKHQGGPSPYRDFFGKEERQKPGPRETRDDWQDTCTFTTALERIEAWIYARVIESIWWQTLTPHMQCPAEDGIRERRELCLRKRCGKLAGPELSDSQKFSIELWKKALSDACQRLCPVRAGGHECGCLSVFARMVMEQCVARLDVAMFNAILRESEDDMPTDPISDPISDPNVLPISIGKLSFGAGAQLKNAVGNWSRLLTNLVGIDEEYSPREGCIEESKMDEIEAPFNSFSLLNATSDLLMLPKDMLLDISVRKELCPVLSSPLIRRVLSNFGPDEFFPDPLPSSLLAALDDEILLEHRLQGREDSTYSTLVSSPPVKYSPPPAACVKEWIGDTNGYIHFGSNTSSVLRKGHTSDDELDELESPLSSLVEEIPATLPPITKLHSNGKSGGTLKQHVDIGGKDRRYQLLREVWAGK